MNKLGLSTKRMKIDRANATMVGIIAGASFVVIFSIVAGNQLLSQRSYQSRVITEKEKAKIQLQSNLEAAKKLADSYKSFVNSPQNIIGGNPSGEGDFDGDNGRIILDSLPSKYDFPALATSIEKIVIGNNYLLTEIDGIDDEINQQQQAGSNNPEPIDMPFEFTVKGNYTSMQGMIDVLERSIRPIPIQKLTLSGNDVNMEMEITAKTFYLPEKTLDIKSKVVK